MAAHAPYGEVLGHALNHPQGDVLNGSQAQVLRLGDDVVLKGMYQFVAKHVVGFLLREGQREHHAPFEAFGDAAHAHIYLAHDGRGLLKVGVVGVHNHRVAPLERFGKHPAVVEIPFLAIGRHLVQQDAVGEVMVYLEMGRLIQLVIELLVDGLVGAEVLRVCR